MCVTVFFIPQESIYVVYGGGFKVKYEHIMGMGKVSVPKENVNFKGET